MIFCIANALTVVVGGCSPVQPSGEFFAARPFPAEPMKRLGYGDIFAIQFSPDAKLIAAVTRFGTSLSKADTFEELTFLRTDADAVTSLAFSPDGTLLASTTLDEPMKLWDVSTGRELATLQGHTWGGTSIFMLMVAQRVKSRSVLPDRKGSSSGAF